MPKMAPTRVEELASRSSPVARGQIEAIAAFRDRWLRNFSLRVGGSAKGNRRTQRTERKACVLSSSTCTLDKLFLAMRVWMADSVQSQFIGATRLSARRRAPVKLRIEVGA